VPHLGAAFGGGTEMLSSREIEQYRETGYVVVKGVLEPALISQCRQVIAEFVGGSAKVAKHDSVYDLEPTHRPEAPRVRRIKSPHVNHPLFWTIANLPKLVGMLEQLLGPSGVRLHGSKINLKAPQYGSPVEWHQDWAFYPHTNDDILAVGIMLDDMLLENGPLMVMPGTHRGPVHDHHVDGFFAGAMDPTATDLDFSRAVPLIAPAGSVSFHHVRLVHGSAQNTSARERKLLLYEFAAADAWPLMGVKDLAEFDGRLVSGAPLIEPRVAPVPVRMPLPPAPAQGSIYENQTGARNRYFKLTETV
jgi:ectoine hydroxylase-related dioxygenase (phytanoyl-CoA dioxygenase family)